MGIKINDQSFEKNLEKNLNDDFMRAAMVKAQDLISNNRKNVLSQLGDGNFPEWQKLSGEVRAHVLENLDFYLHQFSENVIKNGGNVFFAKDAKEASQYVTNLAIERGVKKVVKAKSMVTEEIGLNHKLMDAGVDVKETDLAEYILQLDDWNPPSHMVVPSLHLNKTQIRDVFAKNGYTGKDLPEDLAAFARAQLRNEYVTADMGIYGCNFAIAESGAITLISNEGNIDLCTSAPELQVAVMGMERIVATYEDADICISLLARSAVGAKSTSYTTFVNGITEEGAADGAKEFHVVIVDNGRSEVLKSQFKEVLQCMRCAACLNACPVYRQVGGHSYNAIYSGPLGVVLTPLLAGYDDFKELPYMCSLCGECTEVCPSNIPLHKLIHEHKRVLAEEKKASAFWGASMSGAGMVLSRPWMYKLGTSVAPLMTKPLMVDGKIKKGVSVLKGWTDKRDLPALEKTRFRDWYESRSKGGNK
ncbi:LutB/LldF family L-lactate oxidation iron-sulfur protein [Neobacillus drentensis]|uniref:LutB/LldF family L-lactate oxidation iron-sulfur protein n=1 Tax=Neobacillus drentensis TaxID=220684 RepID=UPI000826F4B0|nr:LutB/LldF family L-lactate oxidation iron-sulfur protein [Neobacillus drentensis]MDR7239212.1 L-lactate dehydrogenase complex protein LldF [Neobacillus drentensis]